MGDVPLWTSTCDQVLDVTKFLKDHPGGELAILTFGGKDATEEFNMIHPPDVIPKSQLRIPMCNWWPKC